MHKLATTPMPFPYVQMLYTLMYVYMYSYPIPLAVSYGWISLPVTLLLSIAIFGINQIGKVHTLLRALAAVLPGSTHDFSCGHAPAKMKPDLHSNGTGTRGSLRDLV